ncbi:TonB-dependent receptor family protein [Maribacter polysaccharolyticus]|uniref:TonB-dependent receptor family protein n=1 Tax=Maribacter polysaccharolyticus TaxID=3020831 RepID=UPI00237FB709|nr:TonB-dependent receptor [Maribacter polysaccharolyticus]MDE3743088.1 TonB-dependent receptor [Maribacter polysaccharolyticus]
MRLVLLILGLSSIPFSSFAQEIILKDSITQLREVVLVDSLKAKQATGIIPSRIIGAKVFQNNSPVEITTSLNQVSGVYVLSGALNTNRITIRGVGARTPYGTDKIRLYYNGIPITNGTGFSTIEAFDLEDMNSIEIIKGPKGTAFGANLGGAILLNPKEALQQATTVTNNLTVGSYGLVKNHMGFTHTDNNLALEFRYGHMNMDGYRENSRFERDGLLLNTSYRIDAKNKIAFLLNYIDYTAQIASSLSQSDFEEDPTQAAYTWKAAQGYEANKYTLAALSHSHDFNAHFSNTTSLFYTYLDHYEPRPFNILDEYTNGFGFRTRFLGDIDLGGQRAQYSIGTELYKDEYRWGTYENLYESNTNNGSLQGDALSDNKEFRSQFNVFGTLTLPFAQYFWGQLGLNINKTKYDFRDLYHTGTENTSGQRSFDAIVLPSLTLKYIFYPKQELYLNISRGFSNPSLEETLTPDGAINPEIEQESGTNYELGSQFSLDNNKLKVNVALYRMAIKNLLVAQRVGEDEYIGKNAGKTKHQGIEVDMDYSLTPAPNFRLTPFLSYSYSNHRFLDFVDGDNDYSGNPLTGVPKHRFNSGLQMLWGNGLYWNITHQYVSGIPLTDANTSYSDSYNLLHTRIGYKKELFKGFTIGVDFGINNMTASKYARSVLINAVAFGDSEPRYYYPGNDRNYYGSLLLNYKL